MGLGGEEFPDVLVLDELGPGLLVLIEIADEVVALRCEDRGCGSDGDGLASAQEGEVWVAGLLGSTFLCWEGVWLFECDHDEDEVMVLGLLFEVSDRFPGGLGFPGGCLVVANTTGAAGELADLGFEEGGLDLAGLFVELVLLELRSALDSSDDAGASLEVLGSAALFASALDVQEPGFDGADRA